MSRCSQVSNIFIYLLKISTTFLAAVAVVSHELWLLTQSRGFCTDNAHKFRAKCPQLREYLGSTEQTSR